MSRGMSQQFDPVVPMPLPPAIILNIPSKLPTGISMVIFRESCESFDVFSCESVIAPFLLEVIGVFVTSGWTK